MYCIRVITVFQFLIYYLNADIEISDISNRIVGGVEADPQEFSFIIAIQPIVAKAVACAGSLLNKYWIVTAAHCIHPNMQNIFQLTGGLHRVNYVDENVQFRKIDKVVVHPNADLSILPYINDIALIKADLPFEINEYVGTIKYADSGPTAGCLAVAIGWGSTSTQGKLTPSNTLQKVYIPIDDDKDCKKFYPNRMVPESSFCAGYTSGGRSTCNGDSGGPLIQQGVLIGVVSSGPKFCGSSKLFALFTRVSNFNGWINKNILM